MCPDFRLSADIDTLSMCEDAWAMNAGRLLLKSRKRVYQVQRVWAKRFLAAWCVSDSDLPKDYAHGISSFPEP
jgi:hypothetical protein